MNFDKHPNKYPTWVTHLGSQCFQLAPTIPQFETKLVEISKQSRITRLLFHTFLLAQFKKWKEPWSITATAVFLVLSN